ncbi:uncharacterized protein LOC142336861 [Convolutriloba macropyga]|uniref:uncharacterized protein LOC142336861 n=1 Tax=Convolutriloba macropyga TaxID=536237 RepID=UPI003F528100
MNEALTCHVCLEMWKEPSALSCGHIICGARFCLGAIVEEGNVICPLCRKQSTVGSTARLYALDDVVRNVTAIGSVQDHRRKRKVCAFHSKVVSSFCWDCHSELCQSCLSGHSNHHEIVERKKYLLLVEKFLQKRLDVNGTKTILDKESVKRWNVIHRLKSVTEDLETELRNISRKCRAIEQLADFRNTETSSSVLSDMGLFVAKESKSVKARGTELCNRIDDLSYSHFCLKSTEGTVTLILSGKDSNRGFDSHKFSKHTLIGDFSFFISLTRVENSKKEEYLQYFVFCQGKHEQWTCKARLALRLEKPEARKRTVTRQLRSQVIQEIDVEQFTEEFDHIFKRLPSDRKPYDGVGFAEFLKWSDLTKLLKSSAGELKFCCAVKLIL